MKTITSFCFLFLFYHSLAQEKPVSVKLSLLALVDEVSFPTIQGGIELKLSKKISWFNEVGIKYRDSYYELADTSFIDSKGFKIKSEIRYYLAERFQSKHRKGWEGIYFALNGFYTKDRHNTEIGYFYSGDTSDFRMDNFDVTKTVGGFNFIVGKPVSLSKHFGLDVYAGLGARFINVKQDNIEFEYGRDMLDGPVDINIHHMRNTVDAKGGSSVMPNLSMGIRLSYAF